MMGVVRANLAVAIGLLMIMALTSVAGADDAVPLTPEDVVAKLLEAFSGGDDEAIFAAMNKLMVEPETEEDQEMAGGAMFIAVWAIMMSGAPQHPAVMDGDRAVVELQARPMEFALTKVDGNWKIDMAATFKRLPERLQLALIPAGMDSQQKACMSNLKQLSIAALMYAQDNDGALPEADKWMDQLAPYLDHLHSEDAFRCPAAPDLEYGYAMNAALSGMKLNQVKDPSNTVLFFESSLGTRNASGSVDAVCDPGRHDEGSNYSFADGSARCSTSVPGFDPLAEHTAAVVGPVLEVTDATFEKEVLNAQGWVLVDMWAGWCGPCINLKPVYHALAAEYEGRARFVSVDVDENPETSKAYNVRSIPLVLLFKDGELVDKQVGFGGAQPFRDWIAGHID